MWQVPATLVEFPVTLVEFSVTLVEFSVTLVEFSVIVSATIHEHAMVEPMSSQTRMRVVPAGYTNVHPPGAQMNDQGSRNVRPLDHPMCIWVHKCMIGGHEMFDVWVNRCASGCWGHEMFDVWVTQCASACTSV